MKSVLTNVSKNVFFMMSLFISLTLISSCNKEDDTMMDPDDPDPSTVVASFTAQVDAENSLTYAFTNNSVVNGIDD